MSPRSQEQHATSAEGRQPRQLRRSTPRFYRAESTARRSTCDLSLLSDPGPGETFNDADNPTVLILSTALAYPVAPMERISPIHQLKSTRDTILYLRRHDCWLSGEKVNHVRSTRGTSPSLCEAGRGSGYIDPRSWPSSVTPHAHPTRSRFVSAHCPPAAVSVGVSVSSVDIAMAYQPNAPL